MSFGKMTRWDSCVSSIGETWLGEVPEVVVNFLKGLKLILRWLFSWGLLFTVGGALLILPVALACERNNGYYLWGYSWVVLYFIYKLGKDFG